jgi:hypothetical protein
MIFWKNVFVRNPPSCIQNAQQRHQNYVNNCKRKWSLQFNSARFIVVYISMCIILVTTFITINHVSECNQWRRGYQCCENRNMHVNVWEWPHGKILTCGIILLLLISEYKLHRIRKKIAFLLLFLQLTINQSSVIYGVGTNVQSQFRNDGSHQSLLLEDK